MKRWVMSVLRHIVDFIWNIALIMAIIVPAGFAVTVLVLPRDYRVEFSEMVWIALNTLPWTWFLLIVGAAGHYAVVWLGLKFIDRERARRIALIASPLVVWWWLLPQNWSPETEWPYYPIYLDHPQLLLPVVVVALLFGWLCRIPDGTRSENPPLQ